MWAWIQPFRHRVSDDFSPATVEEFVQTSILRAKHAQTWGVWRGDELGGLIWIEHVNPVLCQSHVLFKQSFWGRATTETAIRQVYETVFAAGVQKIGSYVFANNHAIRALAKQIGAREEGLLRNQTRQNGLPADMIALGLLKEDFRNANGSTGSNAGVIANRNWRIYRGGRAEQPQKDGNIVIDTDVHPGAGAPAETAGGDARNGTDDPEQHDLAA